MSDLNTPQPAPKFPGYREMAAEEILADGDMAKYAWNKELTPTEYQGFEVGVSGVGLYFRPVAPAPVQGEPKPVGKGRARWNAKEADRKNGNGYCLHEEVTAKGAKGVKCDDCGISFESSKEWFRHRRDQGFNTMGDPSYADLLAALTGAREALERAFFAMGRAGANADLKHPMRAEWEAARVALDSPALANGGKT